MIVVADPATVNTHLSTVTGTIDARWCCRHGHLDDPGDGAPALVGRRTDGTVLEAHYHDGHLDDPVDGSPAWLVRRADGTVVEARHYRRDRRIA